jgi:urease accessory protein UreE
MFSSSKGLSCRRPIGRCHLTAVVRAQRVMIVNTKKGGHAFIGLYLAKELVAAKHDVTIFNDGDSVCILT